MQISTKNVHETLGRSILTDGFKMVLDITRSHGARAYDAQNDRLMVDFFSFFGSNPLGFNHPRMFEKVFEKKLLQFAKAKVSNSDIYTTAFAEFANLFHHKVTPMFDRLFFIEGGALGIENAIKAAQDWKVQKNLKAGKSEKGTQVLHFKEAFHGRTGYTLSLTNTDPIKIKYFPKFDWPRIVNPKLRFPLTEESLKQTRALEEQAVKEIEAAFKNRPDEICAIIIEPIQGEGGDNFFRADFFKTLRTLADQHDVLLIFDEVQTGLGLTGKFWAWEHFGVMPDLMAFGKKVQVCGCAARLNRLQEVDHVFKISGRINSTWGGNIVDMVRSTQFIEIILEEKLLDHVTHLGKKMLKELEGFSKKFSSVTNVRGLGLWMAFDLPTTEIRKKFVETAWNNGLMILSSGTHTVRLRPPLNLQENEASEGLDIITKTLKQI